MVDKCRYKNVIKTFRIALTSKRHAVRLATQAKMLDKERKPKWLKQ